MEQELRMMSQDQPQPKRCNGRQEGEPSRIMINAHVTALDNNGGGAETVTWHLGPGNRASDPYFSGDKIKLPSGKDWYEINFHLVDNCGETLMVDEDDPIWAAMNSSCPPPSGINTDQVQVVGTGRMNLTILNPNSSMGEVRYQLNFRNSNGDRFVLDPIMNNGGGGIPPFE